MTTVAKYDTETPPEAIYECRPVAVEVRDGLSVWIEFSDGESGALDFSHLTLTRWSACEKDFFFAGRCDSIIGEWTK